MAQVHGMHLIDVSTFRTNKIDNNFSCLVPVGLMLGFVRLGNAQDLSRFSFKFWLSLCMYIYIHILVYTHIITHTIYIYMHIYICMNTHIYI